MHPGLPAAYRKFIKPFEGEKVPFMYLDIGDKNNPLVLGKVTAVTGNLIEANGQPTEEVFTWPWRHKGDNSLASRAEVDTAWHAVKDRQDLRKNGGMSYANITDLRLDDAAMERIVTTRLAAQDAELKKRFPAYEVWPLNAQVAIHAVMSLGHFSEFIALHAALSGLLPNFAQASIEALSRGVTPQRNLATAELFLKSAKEVGQVFRNKVRGVMVPLPPPSQQPSFGFDLPNEVAQVATPISAQTFVDGLIPVFQNLEGTKPDIKQIGMLYGQWALETNNGKAMFNNAVGNIKITQSQMNAGVPFFSQFTGTSGVVRPDGVIGEGVNHFRAYHTLEEGINSWLSLLKVARYKAGWDALKNDDTVGFATGIARGGYVAAPSQDSYIQGVLSRNNDFMKNIAPTLQIDSVPKGGNGTISPSSVSLTPSKAPLVLGLTTVVAIGLGYAVLHPLALAGAGLTIHNLYRKVVPA